MRSTGHSMNLNLLGLQVPMVNTLLVASNEYVNDLHQKSLLELETFLSTGFVLPGQVVLNESPGADEFLHHSDRKRTVSKTLERTGKMCSRTR